MDPLQRENTGKANLTRGCLLLSLSLFLVFGGYFLMIRDIVNRSVVNKKRAPIEEQRIQTAFPIEQQKFLDSSPQFILYSLYPSQMEMDDYKHKKKPHFHGFRILGQFQIKETKERSDLLAALYDGIGSSDGKMDKCFNPRHGIRAVNKKKSMDLVICFECEQIELYDEKGKRTIPITTSPKPVFDRTLTEAGVPLPGR